MKNSKFLKSISLFLSIIFFTGNVLLVHAFETNVWKERQKIVTRDSNLVTRKYQNQIAALPNNFSNFSYKPNLNEHLSIGSVSTRNELRGTRNIFQSVMHSLPHQFGTVRKINKSKSDHVIIHIQDVHMNEEAQANIGSAVQSLIDVGHVDLVALEAGFGDLEFSAYRDHEDQALMRELADYLFKEQMVSGPIHTALTSAREIPKMVGVDDYDHYWANVNAYREADKLRPTEKKKWIEQTRILGEEKRALYNKELLQFDQTVQSFQADQIKLGQYLTTLSNNSGEIYSTIEMFLEAFNMETALKLTKVENERAVLLEALSKKLSQAQMKDLFDASMAYRLGAMNHSRFYQYLQNLCERNGVKLARYPAMRDYIQYLLLSDSIDADKLFAEARHLEQSIFESLSHTSEEKSLIKKSRDHYLLGKLLDFALTSEEWNEYSRHSGESRNLGKTLDLVFRRDDVQRFEDFYYHAEARDKAITENLLAAMKKHNAKKVVLVTGGFHSKGITDNILGKGEGVKGRMGEISHSPNLPFSPSVVQFTPKITKLETDHGVGYLSVFSQEKTPLDKLFEGDKLFTAPVVQNPNAAPIALGAAQLSTIGPDQNPSIRRWVIDQHYRSTGRIPNEDNVQIEMLTPSHSRVTVRGEDNLKSQTDVRTNPLRSERKIEKQESGKYYSRYYSRAKSFFRGSPIFSSFLGLILVGVITSIASAAPPQDVKEILVEEGAPILIDFLNIYTLLIYLQVGAALIALAGMIGFILWLTHKYIGDMSGPENLIRIGGHQKGKKLSHKPFFGIVSIIVMALGIGGIFGVGKYINEVKQKVANVEVVQSEENPNRIELKKPALEANQVPPVVQSFIAYLKAEIDQTDPDEGQAEMQKIYDLIEAGQVQYVEGQLFPIEIAFDEQVVIDPRHSKLEAAYVMIDLKVLDSFLKFSDTNHDIKDMFNLLTIFHGAYVNDYQKNLLSYDLVRWAFSEIETNPNLTPELRKQYSRAHIATILQNFQRRFDPMINYLGSKNRTAQDLDQLINIISENEWTTEFFQLFQAAVQSADGKTEQERPEAVLKGLFQYKTQTDPRMLNSLEKEDIEDPSPFLFKNFNFQNINEVPQEEESKDVVASVLALSIYSVLLVGFLLALPIFQASAVPGVEKVAALGLGGIPLIVVPVEEVQKLKRYLAGLFGNKSARSPNLNGLNRRSFLRQSATAAGAAALGTLVPVPASAQRRQPRNQPTEDKVQQEILKNVSDLPNHMSDMQTNQRNRTLMFARSNKGDPDLGNIAYLYDQAIRIQAYLSEGTPQGVRNAEKLVQNIKENWFKREDLFSDETQTKPMTGYIAGADATDGFFREGHSESKVESGPILHLGMAALNTYFRARELKVKVNSKMLLDIGMEAADYALAVQDPNTGLVRHGPIGKIGDERDQRFNFDLNLPRLYEVATNEHQWEAFYLWNLLRKLPNAPNKTRYLAAAKKLFPTIFKVYSQDIQNRFRKSYNLATRQLSNDLPTDVQVWPISIVGVKTLLTRLKINDIEEMLAKVDAEHSSLNSNGKITGYDFQAGRRKYVSVEWSSQVIAAKLEFASYLKDNPKEAAKIRTTWQEYAQEATATAIYLSKLPRQKEFGGLYYTYDADGRPAEDIDTTLGFPSQEGAALISSAYLFSIANEYDPAAYNGGNIKFMQPTEEVLRRFATDPAETSNAPQTNILTLGKSGELNLAEKQQHNANAKWWIFDQAFPLQRGQTMEVEYEITGATDLGIQIQTQNHLTTSQEGVIQKFSNAGRKKKLVIPITGNVMMKQLTFHIGPQAWSLRLRGSLDATIVIHSVKIKNRNGQYFIVPQQKENNGRQGNLNRGLERVGSLVSSVPSSPIKASSLLLAATVGSILTAAASAAEPFVQVAPEVTTHSAGMLSSFSLLAFGFPSIGSIIQAILIVVAVGSFIRFVWGLWQGETNIRSAVLLVVSSLGLPLSAVFSPISNSAWYYGVVVTVVGIAILAISFLAEIWRDNVFSSREKTVSSIVLIVLLGFMSLYIYFLPNPSNSPALKHSGRGIINDPDDIFYSRQSALNHDRGERFIPGEVIYSSEDRNEHVRMEIQKSVSATTAFLESAERKAKAGNREGAQKDFERAKREGLELVLAYGRAHRAVDYYYIAYLRTLRLQVQLAKEVNPDYFEDAQDTSFGINLDHKMFVPRIVQVGASSMARKAIPEEKRSRLIYKDTGWQLFNQVTWEGHYGIIRPEPVHTNSQKELDQYDQVVEDGLTQAREKAISGDLEGARQEFQKVKRGALAYILTHGRRYDSHYRYYDAYFRLIQLQVGLSQEVDKAYLEDAENTARNINENQSKDVGLYVLAGAEAIAQQILNSTPGLDLTVAEKFETSGTDNAEPLEVAAKNQNAAFDPFDVDHMIEARRKAIDGDVKGAREIFGKIKSEALSHVLTHGKQREERRRFYDLFLRLSLVQSGLGLDVDELYLEDLEKTRRDFRESKIKIKEKFGISDAENNEILDVEAEEVPETEEVEPSDSDQSSTSFLRKLLTSRITTTVLAFTLLSSFATIAGAAEPMTQAVPTLAPLIAAPSLNFNEIVWRLHVATWLIIGIVAIAWIISFIWARLSLDLDTGKATSTPMAAAMATFISFIVFIAAGFSISLAAGFQEMDMKKRQKANPQSVSQRLEKIGDELGDAGDRIGNLAEKMEALRQRLEKERTEGNSDQPTEVEEEVKEPGEEKSLSPIVELLTHNYHPSNTIDFSDLEKLIQENPEIGNQVAIQIKRAFDILTRINPNTFANGLSDKKFAVSMNFDNGLAFEFPETQVNKRIISLVLIDELWKYIIKDNLFPHGGDLTDDEREIWNLIVGETEITRTIEELKIKFSRRNLKPLGGADQAGLNIEQDWRAQAKFDEYLEWYLEEFAESKEVTGNDEPGIIFMDMLITEGRVNIKKLNDISSTRLRTKISIAVLVMAGLAVVKFFQKFRSRKALPILLGITVLPFAASYVIGYEPLLSVLDGLPFVDGAGEGLAGTAVASSAFIALPTENERLTRAAMIKRESVNKETAIKLIMDWVEEKYWEELEPIMAKSEELPIIEQAEELLFKELREFFGKHLKEPRDSDSFIDVKIELENKELKFFLGSRNSANEEPTYSHEHTIILFPHYSKVKSLEKFKEVAAKYGKANKFIQTYNSELGKKALNELTQSVDLISFNPPLFHALMKMLDSTITEEYFKDITEKYRLTNVEKDALYPLWFSGKYLKKGRVRLSFKNIAPVLGGIGVLWLLFGSAANSVMANSPSSIATVAEGIGFTANNHKFPVEQIRPIEAVWSISDFILPSILGALVLIGLGIALSFHLSRKEKRVNDLIDSLWDAEFEQADQIIKKLFNTKISPENFYHLIRFMNRLNGSNEQLIYGLARVLYKHHQRIYSTSTSGQLYAFLNGLNSQINEMQESPRRIFRGESASAEEMLVAIQNPLTRLWRNSGPEVDEKPGFISRFIQYGANILVLVTPSVTYAFMAPFNGIYQRLVNKSYAIEDEITKHALRGLVYVVVSGPEIDPENNEVRHTVRFPRSFGEDHAYRRETVLRNGFQLEKFPERKELWMRIANKGKTQIYRYNYDPKTEKISNPIRIDRPRTLSRTLQKPELSIPKIKELIGPNGLFQSLLKHEISHLLKEDDPNAFTVERDPELDTYEGEIRVSVRSGYDGRFGWEQRQMGIKFSQDYRYVYFLYANNEIEDPIKYRFDFNVETGEITNRTIVGSFDEFPFIDRIRKALNQVSKAGSFVLKPFKSTVTAIFDVLNNFISIVPFRLSFPAILLAGILGFIGPVQAGQPGLTSSGLSPPLLANVQLELNLLTISLFIIAFVLYIYTRSQANLTKYSRDHEVSERADRNFFIGVVATLVFFIVALYSGLSNKNEKPNQFIPEPPAAVQPGEQDATFEDEEKRNVDPIEKPTLNDVINGLDFPLLNYMTDPFPVNKTNNPLWDDMRFARNAVISAEHRLFDSAAQSAYGMKNNVLRYKTLTHVDLIRFDSTFFSDGSYIYMIGEALAEAGEFSAVKHLYEEWERAINIHPRFDDESRSEELFLLAVSMQKIESIHEQDVFLGKPQSLGNSLLERARKEFEESPDEPNRDELEQIFKMWEEAFSTDSDWDAFGMRTFYDKEAPIADRRAALDKMGNHELGSVHVVVEQLLTSDDSEWQKALLTEILKDEFLFGLSHRYYDGARLMFLEFMDKEVTDNVAQLRSQVHEKLKGERVTPARTKNSPFYDRAVETYEDVKETIEKNNEKEASPKADEQSNVKSGPALPLTAEQHADLVVDFLLTESDGVKVTAEQINLLLANAEINDLGRLTASGHAWLSRPVYRARFNEQFQSRIDGDYLRQTLGWSGIQRRLQQIMTISSQEQDIGDLIQDSNFSGRKDLTIAIEDINDNETIRLVNKLAAQNEARGRGWLFVVVNSIEEKKKLESWNSLDFTWVVAPKDDAGPVIQNGVIYPKGYENALESSRGEVNWKNTIVLKKDSDVFSRDAFEHEMIRNSTVISLTSWVKEVLGIVIPPQSLMNMLGVSMLTWLSA